MSRLNIRCCCQPTKVLGSMPWPERADGTLQLYWRLTYKESIFAPIQQIALQVREFQDGPHREWAVFGEDRPIEFWRTMRGYRPPEQT